MQLIQSSSIKALDFLPRAKWPRSMPAIAATFGADKVNAPHVIAGFEILGDRSASGAHLLVLDAHFQTFETALEGIAEFHGGLETLAHFEKLRLSAKLAQLFKVELPSSLNWLLELPIDFQNYCDDKGMAFRTLEPLKFIPQAWNSLSHVVRTLGASHAECRELFDLWCDLLTTKRVPLAQLEIQQNISPGGAALSTSAYLIKLRAIRFPTTLSQDSALSNNLTKVTWPKNVRASFDRNGDTGSVQLKIQLDSEKTYLQTMRKLSELQAQSEFKKIWESNSP